MTNAATVCPIYTEVETKLCDPSTTRTYKSC